MLRIAFAISIAVLAVGCHERNPAYCESNTDCSAGDICNVENRRCQSPDAPDAASPCTGSSECPANAPICQQDQCTVCEPGADGDAACAARDPATGHCAGDGRCLECLSSDDCGGTAPVCDLASGACRPCADHEECVLSQVCDLDGGSCLDPASVIYVDDSGTDGSTCGTPSSPCASIGGNQGALDKVVDGRRTIKVRGGNYVEAVDIDLSSAVSLIGRAATITPPLNSNQPAVYVRNGSTVAIDGLTLSTATGGTGADGILCDGSSYLLVRSATVSDNTGSGIEAAGCTVEVRGSRLEGNAGEGLRVGNSVLTMERSSVVGNLGGGVSINDSQFRLTNNFIVSNGTAGAVGSSFGGLKIDNTGSVPVQELTFNTIADSRAQNTAISAGVFCSVVTAMTARSNIVYGRSGGTTLMVGNCLWAYSDIEGGMSGTGNIGDDPMFFDLGAGDFHITDGSPCRNVADPAATLGIDFDGETRPEGSGRDIGADEFVP